MRPPNLFSSFQAGNKKLQLRRIIVILEVSLDVGLRLTLASPDDRLVRSVLGAVVGSRVGGVAVGSTAVGCGLLLLLVVH